jgi:hypothetical protein
VAALVSGQPCQEIPFGNQCASYLLCLSGSCQVLPTVGQTCLSAEVCLDGDYCNSSTTCAALKPVGTPCVPTALDCSLSALQVDPPDGGVPFTIDEACLPEADGGGPICQSLPPCQ